MDHVVCQCGKKRGHGIRVEVDKLNPVTTQKQQESYFSSFEQCFRYPTIICVKYFLENISNYWFQHSLLFNFLKSSEGDARD